MPGIHYLKINFGIDQYKIPEIYDFLWVKLQEILKKTGTKTIQLEIERLEPLDAIYTNLDLDEKKIKKAFHEFAKCHHLKEVSSIEFDKSKTSLKAKLSLANLSKILKDYNLLFDIFFTDLIIKTDKKLTIDMMDGFNNSLLVIGNKKELDVFVKAAKKLVSKKTEFEFVYHKAERRT